MMRIHIGSIGTRHMAAIGVVYDKVLSEYYSHESKPSRASIVIKI
jgi:hypothetical protein